jgi:glycerol transport system ATP-binding protein
VYHNPSTLKVAEVFSDPPINYISGTVQGSTARLGHDVEIQLDGHMKYLPAGKYKFGVRSHSLFLSRTSEEDTEIQARVELSEITGSETFIHINYNNSRLVVQENGVQPLRIGAEISIYVNPSCFFVYDEAGTLVVAPSRDTIKKG